MIDAFVTIELTEEEFDQVIEWLGDQEIQSGLYKLYDRLMIAVEAVEEAEEAEDTEDEA